MRGISSPRRSSPEDDPHSAHSNSLQAALYLRTTTKTSQPQQTLHQAVLVRYCETHGMDALQTAGKQCVATLEAYKMFGTYALKWASEIAAATRN